MTVGFLILTFVPILNGCFMMFVPAMSMIDDTSETNADPNLNTAIIELMQKSVNELIDNRGQNKQILLGEVKVVGNFISADKIRMLLLKTLREKNELRITTRGEVSTDAERIADLEKLSPHRSMAVLNAQIYNSEGQIWQVQQLVDMRSNRIIWSGIQSIPMPNSA